MKRILLMTDFSENARNAIRFAIGSFGQGVQYVLLNSFVVTDTTTSLLPITKVDDLRKKSSEGLVNELNLIKSEFPHLKDLRVQLIADWGEPINALHHIASEIRIDLVIMGTKGASGLQKVFIGTVTASIIRKTPLPVMAIPEGATPGPLKKIVFASDLNNKNNAIIHPLARIAIRFDSEVLLLNVAKPGGLADGKVERSIEKLNQFLIGVNKSWHSIEARNIVAGLDQFCEEEDADLLVVIARQKSFYDRFFNRSISQQMVFQSKLPILVLQES